MSQLAGEAAGLPPSGLPGLDPAWSRLVPVVDADGQQRVFHVLDRTVPDRTVPDRTVPDRTVPGPDERQQPMRTLLCVHGNPTWSYLWRRVVAAAPPGWRVIAVDQLDMGWSQRTGTVRGLARRIDDLSRLTDALGVTGPVVTVAHDWGGPISLGWVAAHHDQVRGVVLTNTAVHQPAGSPAPSLIRLARSPGLLPAVCVRTPTFVRATTSVSRFGGQPRPSAAVRDAFAAPYATPARRRAVGEFVADIPLSDEHPSMPALRAVAESLPALADTPVGLFWGPADPVFSDLYLRDLLTRLPHADVHRYEGASHLVTEDAPTFAADLWRWIEARVVVPSAATTGDAAVPLMPAGAAARHPMWRDLEERQDDGSIALVERAGHRRDVSWALLSRRVRDLAAGLAAIGVEPGHRVALLVPPGADLTAAVYACWRIGAVVVIADAGLGLRGLGRALRGSWPDHVIAIPAGLAAARGLRIAGTRILAGAHDALTRAGLGAQWSMADLARLGAGMPLPPEPGPDDPAAVLFTSGATGPAKGVGYRHGQIEANRDTLRALYGLTADDRLVAAFAPFALYGPALGLSSVVPDVDVTRPGTLTARALAEAVESIAATVVWASPAALRNVLATQADLGVAHRTALARVRLLISAGAPVPAPLLREMATLLPNAEPHTPYGMTEVLPVADITLAGIEGAGSGDGVCVGHPVPGVQLRISPLDADGQATGEPIAEAGITGEILIAATHGKQAYDRLWATEAAAARDPGWHRSGDVGHLDDAGRLWVEGRLAHVIVSAEGIVTPVGVETRVEQVPGVAQAACVGVGPAGTAAVVVVVRTAVAPQRAGSADPGLAEAVRAAAGIPVAAVLCVPRLPVDIRHNSKIDRTVLGAWAAAVLAGGRARLP